MHENKLPTSNCSILNLAQEIKYLEHQLEQKDIGHQSEKKDQQIEDLQLDYKHQLEKKDQQIKNLRLDYQHQLKMKDLKHQLEIARNSIK